MAIARHGVLAETTETAETQFSRLHPVKASTTSRLVGLQRSVRYFPTCRALGQLLSTPPTITNFNFCSKRIAMSLSPEQTRTVKRYAGPLFANPTPQWRDIGEDERRELHELLVSRLRETRNTEIADIIHQNPHLCWKILQEKVKSLRYTQRKSTFPAPVGSCSKLLLRRTLLRLNRRTQGFCIANGGPGGMRHSFVTSAPVIVVLQKTHLLQPAMPACVSGRSFWGIWTAFSVD